jgi:hypothetical protein
MVGDVQMKKEDVDKMTLQEAMDYSINKLVEQGGQCTLRGSGGCAYGNSKGQHCAIGWLLDEDNKGLMQADGSSDKMIRDYYPYIPDLIKKNRDLFFYFQIFHDEDEKNCRSDKLNEMAKDYGIDVETNPNWNKWVEMGT